ncbi:MAG: ATP-binding protein [Edaphobacter sp.]|uniref:ATP-binding protein n=1 Tax=Edaphobacter sp. TaxID=1934404 RepID=UPI00238492CE|nr:ATP-binding protein [Edaphobacter sp.]MDE1175598.1 ATP-binding protein [Edaphobacter sp.]
MPDCCEIRIADHGPGFPEEALPYLFDAFYRVSESRNQEDGESGLGFSISRRIAELHHGDIFAKNRKDTSGLIVRVLLPIA